MVKNTEILKRKGLEHLISEFDNIILDTKQLLMRELSEEVDESVITYLLNTIETNEKLKKRMHAISPIEGRYDRYVDELHSVTSQYEWTRKRVYVEVEYLIALTDVICNEYEGEKKHLLSREFTDKEKEKLRSLYKNFDENDFRKIQLLDREINHDVVAMTTWMVYELGDSLEKDIRNEVESAIHFALTSDDIDGNVYSLTVKELFKEHYMPALLKLQETLIKKVETWDPAVFAGQTHGQYAEYTTLHKVFANFISILGIELDNFANKYLLMPGKLGGAIGNNNDLIAAYPDYADWDEFGRYFVEGILKLKLELMADQPVFGVQHQKFYDDVVNTNNVLIKVCADFWDYCSRGLFQKKTTKGESGSSVMAQKTNPWLSEGAEEYLTEANAEFQGFERQIKYKMQGDLRRSIQRRGIGEPFAKTIIGIKRLIQEINKYEPNYDNIQKEVDEHPEMSAAAVQTILKREGISDAYDTLKEKTMGRKVQESDYVYLTSKLLADNKITFDVRDEILGIIKPENNIGDAGRLTAIPVTYAKARLKELKLSFRKEE